MAIHKTNLLDLDRASLEAFFAARGEKAFRASQVLKWIHQHGARDFAAMTNLSKALRQQLAASAEIRLPEVIRRQVARDGTRKWVLRLADGNAVETVFIPEEDRGTLCVSSQAGCALNCSFCATARQGYSRNLTAGEIVAQLWIASRELAAPAPGDGARAGTATRHITNVVLMGMGEPLLNFDAVVTAMRIMLEDHAYGLSRRRVTLSTAGLVPGIDRLRACCDVSLAVSLHAPDDALRDVLVPLNRKYPIEELMAACRRYAAAAPRRRITFEYVMLDGVNDSLAHARRLLAWMRQVPSKVNLIPFNPFPGAPYRCSPPEVIDAFREVLIRGGITTVTRKTRGEDIDAACGQLVGQVQDRTRRSQRFPVVLAGAGS